MSTDEEPKYIWKCKCGKFQINVFAEPLFSMNCYCHGCVAPVRYINEKYNADGTGTSAATADGNGTAKVMLALKDIKFAEENPSEKLGYVKVGDKGEQIRTYLKCCGTQLNTAGGKAFPTAFRPFNRNALYNASDMSLFEPSQPPMNVNCQHAFVGMDDIPEPKHPGAPPGIMFSFVSGIFKKKLGISGAPFDGEQCFYADGGDVDDVVPITWEE